MLSLLGQTIFNTCIYYTVKPVLNQKFCVQNRQVFELYRSINKAALYWDFNQSSVYTGFWLIQDSVYTGF
jgi:hypothetical protein